MYPMMWLAGSDWIQKMFSKSSLQKYENDHSRNAAMSGTAMEEKTTIPVSLKNRLLTSGFSFDGSESQIIVGSVLALMSSRPQLCTNNPPPLTVKQKGKIVRFPSNYAACDTSSIVSHNPVTL